MISFCLGICVGSSSLQNFLVYVETPGPEEGEEKEGEQANSVREETQTEDPIELLNRMSGKSDRLRDSAKQNLSPITPTFDYDGYDI